MEAIKKELGLAEDLTLKAAVDAANEQSDTKGEGTLAEQVEKLTRELGLDKKKKEAYAAEKAAAAEEAPVPEVEEAAEIRRFATTELGVKIELEEEFEL